MYFLAMPLEDWLRAVDARWSSPHHRPSMDADGESSDSHGAGGDDMQMDYVHEKRHEKQRADEEPSTKRRKTARPSRGEEGTVSIGASVQT